MIIISIAYVGYQSFMNILKRPSALLNRFAPAHWFSLNTQSLVSAFLACLLLTMAANAEANQRIRPYHASYKASWKAGIPISGKAEQKLQQTDEGQWKLSFSAKTFFIKITEDSHFQWQNSTIQPEHYEYHRSGLVKPRKAILDFDWQQQRVTNNVQSKPWKMPLATDTLDKLSYQLQLRQDLLQGKEELSYVIADGGKAKEYRFQQVGEALLETDLGTFKTVIIDRIRQDDSPRHTRLWLAPDWDFLPIKLQQKEKDGQVYEMLLKDATMADQPVKGNKDTPLNNND